MRVVGAVPARWGGGRGRARYQGDGAGRASKPGAHAPTATATSRGEWGGASVRGKRAEAPRLSPRLLRRRSASAGPLLR